MRVLFRSVQIVDKQSGFNGKAFDLLIENGNIVEIGSDIPPGTARVLDMPGVCVSPGWVDLRVALRDPGFEHEDDVTTVTAAAARGGFTTILLMPNSSPAVDSKDTLNYLLRAAQGNVVNLLVSSTVTKGAKGVDFTEMIDMHRAGAVAFTDGAHAIQNPDILLKSLQYLRPYAGLLINHPMDEYLSLFGQMHEGKISTLLGFKGIPPLAEEMMLIRDLKLLEYALENTPVGNSEKPVLHFSLLSTRNAVQLIRDAKEKGLPVSCDIAAHQLAFTDEDLVGFDTNLKVIPPFRSADHLEALREGLADGTIDAIVSDHTPHTEESKNLEFDLAEFGITGLETAFSVALKHSELPIDEVIAKLTHQPRRILGLPAHTISVGAPANLTFFDPNEEWSYTTSLSKSKNSPFLGQVLKGSVKGVFNNGRWVGF